MRYAVGVLTAMLVPFVVASGAQAAGEKYSPIPKAAEIVVQCIEVSAQQFNLGTTADVGNAYIKRNNCLQKAIVENLEILVGRAAPENWSASEAVDTLSRNYSDFYWVLHNRNEACGISCGTMGHNAGEAYLNSLLETILEKVLKLRTENETPFSSYRQ